MLPAVVEDVQVVRQLLLVRKEQGVPHARGMPNHRRVRQIAGGGDDEQALAGCVALGGRVQGHPNVGA
eukprot:1896869-Prymnesium_polylepis.1